MGVSEASRRLSSHKHNRKEAMWRSVKYRQWSHDLLTDLLTVFESGSISVASGMVLKSALRCILGGFDTVLILY